MDNACDGVVECTALVLAESCSEIDGRLTLFGLLDEIRPSEEGETSLVVYAKFEGCEHASDKEWRARILISDEDGEVLLESNEYSIWLDGTEEPVTIVAAFDLPEDFGDGERVLWIEAVLDDETLSQTVIRIHDRYTVDLRDDPPGRLYEPLVFQ
jgi:hypothetical protein